MRLDLSKLADLPLQTSFWYGVFRTGKTRFCCTFPRVAWFGTMREGGFKTIKYMKPADFYEPDRPPQVYLIKSPPEFMAHLNKDVIPQIKTGAIKTIVIELSVYSDEMIRARAEEQSWQKYADLEKHLMFVDELLKQTPGVRVCYNALATTEDNDNKPAGPLMAGRAIPRKLPALIDCVGYFQAQVKDGVFEPAVHLQPFANYPAGHRYGELLPALIRNPTFRKIEGVLAGTMTADANGYVQPVTFVSPTLPSLPPLR